eukprot:738342-Pyramimonas_sp.AAC.1
MAPCRIGPSNNSIRGARRKKTNHGSVRSPSIRLVRSAASESSGSSGLLPTSSSEDVVVD